MGIKITDMDIIPSLSKNDLIEVARPGANGSANSTYAASMQQIGAYTKNLNNGGFKGQMTKALSDVTYADAGVWYWEGEAPLNGMPSRGLLEVVTSVSAEDVSGLAEAPTIFLRLTNGEEVYVQTKQGGASSNWGILSNKNGNKIYSGYTTDATVQFPSGFFSQRPSVVCTPRCDIGDAVYLINLSAVETTGFSVIRFALSKAAVKTETESEKIEEQEGGSGNKTTTTTTTTMEYNQWTDGTFGYYYIATLDG